MGPCDLDTAILKGLAQRVEHIAIELRDLVEKERAVVGLRDQARTEPWTATDHRGI